MEFRTKREAEEADPQCECGEVLSAHRHGIGGRPAMLEEQEPRRWLCRGFVRALLPTLPEEA